MKRIFHVFVLCCLVDVSQGNGRLMDPPMRSTLWRLGYDAPQNYDDHTLDCGGLERQYNTNGGKCGVCGDPWDGTRENEAGGKYAPIKPIIPRHYTAGSDVNMTVKMLAPRGGYFEFRLCRVDAPDVPVTQACLDDHLLEIINANGAGSRFPVPLAGEQEEQVSLFDVTVRLPPDVTCSQCVVQWKYHAGNEWGTDASGKECIGCGPQFEQYNCADVAILNSGENNFLDVDPVDRRNSDPVDSPGSNDAGGNTLEPTPDDPVGSSGNEPTDPLPSNNPHVGPHGNEEPIGSDPFDNAGVGPVDNGAGELPSNPTELGPFDHPGVGPVDNGAGELPSNPTELGPFDHPGVGPVDNGGVESTESGLSGHTGVIPPDEMTSGSDGIGNRDMHPAVDPVIFDPMQGTSQGIGGLPDLQAHKFEHGTNEYETSVIPPEEQASGSAHSAAPLHDGPQSGSYGTHAVRSRDYTPGWLGSYTSSYLPVSWRPRMEMPTWRRPHVQTNMWVTNTWRQPNNLWGNAMNTNSPYSNYISPWNQAGNTWSPWNSWRQPQQQPQNQWAFNGGPSFGWNNRPLAGPRNDMNRWWSEPHSSWSSRGHPNQQRLQCPLNQRFVCSGLGRALQGFVTEQYCYQNCGLGKVCPPVCSCTCVAQFSLDCKYNNGAGPADVSDNEWCNTACNGGECPVGYCDCQTVQNW